MLFLAAVVIAALMIVPTKPSYNFEDQSVLKKFSSENELKEFLAANQQGGYYGDIRAMKAESAAHSEQGTQRDYSSTNIQVAGVDEADYVKNDGKYIYKIAGESVYIVDANPENMSIVSSINLSGRNPTNIYVSGDRLVVFGNEFGYSGIWTLGFAEKFLPYPGPSQSTTYINIYDISDRSAPALEKSTVFNGTYADSRVIGDYVYAVVASPVYYVQGEPVIPAFSPTQRGFPEIYYFDTPSASYQFTNIVSVNINDEASLTDSKVFMLGYSTSLYVSQNNVYLVYQKNVKQNYMMDRVLDEIILPAAPAKVANEISSIRNSDMPEYKKQSEISSVLGAWREGMTPDEAEALQNQFGEKYGKIQADLSKELDKSVIHKVALSNGKIEYKAKGEVPGHPLNQFSMDEHNGFFRIATTTSGFFGGPVIMTAELRTTSGGFASGGQATGAVESSVPPSEPKASVNETEKPEPVPSPVVNVPTAPRSNTANHLYVLDENMNTVGKLEDLAPGERIFSARFLGDRAYLVTFVQIDPLFVIDLRNPASPRVLGELKIPGVSDYLHAYDENHIIGVGRAATGREGRTLFNGVKIAIFDVTDVSNPKESSAIEIGARGTRTDVTYDHKAFLFSKEKNLLVIPVTVYEKGSNEFYGDYGYNGAHVFKITDSEITLRGYVTHDQRNDTYDYGQNYVTRSLYIGDYLYTISNGMIKANKIDTLEEAGSVKLPAGERVYYTA